MPLWLGGSVNNQVVMAVSWGRGGGREGGSGSLPGLFLSLLCCDCLMQASSWHPYWKLNYPSGWNDAASLLFISIIARGQKCVSLSLLSSWLFGIQSTFLSEFWMLEWGEQVISIDCACSWEWVWMYWSISPRGEYELKLFANTHNNKTSSPWHTFTICWIL